MHASGIGWIKDFAPDAVGAFDKICQKLSKSATLQDDNRPGRFVLYLFFGGVSNSENRILHNKLGSHLYGFSKITLRECPGKDVQLF